MRKPAPARPIAKPISEVAKTPMTKAVHSILARMDAQHAEIAKLLREVRAALG